MLATTPSTPAPISPDATPRTTLVARDSSGASHRDAPPDARFNLALTIDAPARTLASVLASQDLNGLAAHLRRHLDGLREQLHDASQRRQAALATGAVLSGGLSVGYVVWLLRGGALVGSMLSALPAWQLLDPMPILARPRRPGEDPAPPDDDADPGNARVEALFDATRPPPPPKRAARAPDASSQEPTA